MYSNSGDEVRHAQSKPLPDLPAYNPFERYVSAPVDESQALEPLSPLSIAYIRALVDQVIASSGLKDPFLWNVQHLVGSGSALY